MFECSDLTFIKILKNIPLIFRFHISQIKYFLLLVCFSIFSANGKFRSATVFALAEVNLTERKGFFLSYRFFGVDEGGDKIVKSNIS